MRTFVLVLLVTLLPVALFASPLFDAVEMRDIGLIRSLSDEGADMDERDELENTPLIRAAELGYADVAEALVIRGAGLNLRNLFGFTPLATAVFHARPEIIDLLLEAGADEDIPTRHNIKPVTFAQAKGFSTLKEYADFLKQQKEPDRKSALAPVADDATLRKKLAYLLMMTETSEAIRLIIRSADAGDREAQYLIGYLLHQQEDDARASAYLLRSGTSGFAASYSLLGDIHREKGDTPENVATAYRYYDIAASWGDATGLMRVGLALRDGIGRAVNLEQSRKMLQRAADAGNADAMYHLGMMELAGLGKDPDEARGRELLTAAAKLKQWDAVLFFRKESADRMLALLLEESASAVIPWRKIFAQYDGTFRTLANGCERFSFPKTWKNYYGIREVDVCMTPIVPSVVLMIDVTLPADIRKKLHEAIRLSPIISTKE